jgi:tRNA(adenine34) deaminase
MAASDFAPADSDSLWMAAALSEARSAPEHADVPVGCVIVDNTGQELARAHNRREADADPTAHAEILALRQAASRRGHWRLDDCTLFVTLEPCAMCAGAMINARLGRLVFGALDAKAGAVHSLYRLAEDPRQNHRFAVSAGCGARESIELLQSFFRGLRARGPRPPR